MKTLFPTLKSCTVMITLSIISITTISGQVPASVVYSNDRLEQTDLYRNGNEYQRDLLLFFDMLSTTHPAFGQGMPSPFSIDEMCREGYEWAATCDSKEELGRRFQAAVAGLNDGHTLVMRDYNNSLIYPFKFFKVDDKFYLETIARKHASLLGRQLVKINHVAIGDIVDSFRSSLSYENETDFIKQLSNVISFELLWGQNPYRREDKMIVLTFDDGYDIIIEPVMANNMDLVAIQPGTAPTWSIRQNTKMPFSYQIVEDRSICYLQFTLCQDKSTMSIMLKNSGRNLSEEQIEQQLATIPRFDSFLADMFSEIATKNIKTLVVDVRGNGGGNSSLCNMLLSWLMPIEEMKTGNALVRFSSLWEKCYPDLSKRYQEAFARKGIRYQLGTTYDSVWLSDNVLSEDDLSNISYDDLFIYNDDVSKIFKGDVVFIQNSSTYSSAGMLIVDAIDNHIGKLIGSKSSFRPCNYGDMLGWQLPNTGITGYVSHKYFTRPDTTKCAEIAIFPDVDINYTVEDVVGGEDVYWKWIAENYGL